MSLSKIVITGQVVRNPEKRFTESNLAISSFSMDFGKEDEEKVIRVFSIGKVAERIAETVKKGQNIVVEGRLQTNSVKTDSGTDKKFFEINAQNIEILGESNKAQTDEKEEFSLSEEISDDNLIGEDEIPF